VNCSRDRKSPHGRRGTGGADEVPGTQAGPTSEPSDSRTSSFRFVPMAVGDLRRLQDARSARGQGDVPTASGRTVSPGVTRPLGGSTGGAGAAEERRASPVPRGLSPKSSSIARSIALG